MTRNSLIVRAPATLNVPVLVGEQLSGLPGRRSCKLSTEWMDWSVNSPMIGVCLPRSCYSPSPVGNQSEDSKLFFFNY